MYTFIYPSNPLNSKIVEDDYKEEYKAIKSQGFSTALFDLDNLSISHIDKNMICIYRGWMLNSSEYYSLETSVIKSNSSMLTSKTDYYKSHYLINYYDSIKLFTPKTVFCSKDTLKETIENVVKWDTFFIKDFVKSLDNGTPSFASNYEEALNIVNMIEKYRGSIEGGISIREFIDIIPESENRYFVFNGKVFSPKNNNSPSCIYSSFVNEVAKLHPLKFFSIDVVKDIYGKEWIIEIGDGQVSGLKKWSVNDFIEIFN